MPTIPLYDYTLGPDFRVFDPAGGTLGIPRTRFRCLVKVPGQSRPYDAIIDTGAPFIIFPEKVWSRFRAGVDFDFLPPVAPLPPALVAGWQFAYHFARFRVTLTLTDTGLTASVPRPGVIAQFAVGDPPGWRAVPPIIVGLWGGLLEGGSVRIERDARTYRATCELMYP